MKRILVVDDNPAFLETIKIGLKRAGFFIETAHSGGDALERLRKKEFDIMFSDIHMPGMTGVELADTVSAEYPDVKIVLMTGYNFELDEIVYDLIIKPFANDELIEKLSEG